MQSCDPQARVHSRIENGTPGQLEEFLRALPGKAECDLSIVYLASHQSPAGEWDFTQKRMESWNELLADAEVPAHPRRLVILDACFAAGVQRHPRWVERLGTTCVYAAGASEETHQLNFRNRLPIDMQRRFPAASAWVASSLAANRDGRLSFFGFALAQAFVASAQPPRRYEDWVAMLRRSEQVAVEFRRNTSRRFASAITVFTPATGEGRRVREAGADGAE